MHFYPIYVMCHPLSNHFHYVVFFGGKFCAKKLGKKIAVALKPNIYCFASISSDVWGKLLPWTIKRLIAQLISLLSGEKSQKSAINSLEFCNNLANLFAHAKFLFVLELWEACRQLIGPRKLIVNYLNYFMINSSSSEISAIAAATSRRANLCS